MGCMGHTTLIPWLGLIPRVAISVYFAPIFQSLVNERFEGFCVSSVDKLNLAFESLLGNSTNQPSLLLIDTHRWLSEVLGFMNPQRLVDLD